MVREDGTSVGREEEEVQRRQRNVNYFDYSFLL